MTFLPRGNEGYRLDGIGDSPESWPDERRGDGNLLAFHRRSPAPSIESPPLKKLINSHAYKNASVSR